MAKKLIEICEYVARIIIQNLKFWFTVHIYIYFLEK